VLLILSMFLTGVAILVLTVPIFFPVAMSLGIDPIHLGILTAIACEMGGVIPPVGLNLFAVSGTTGVPVSKVTLGSLPYLFTDGIVMTTLLFFPSFALWLPTLLVVSVSDWGAARTTRARVSTPTEAAPPASSTAAQASTVAPVVSTSSTS